MIPGILRFGGGASATTLHPIVLVAMLATIVLMLLLPRRYIIVPFLFVVILTPLGQQVYVAGVHLFVLRILILAGWIRILWTKLAGQTQIVSNGWNPVDKVYILWSIWGAFAFTLLFKDVGAFVYEGGVLWDLVGGYFLLRFLIRDEEDIYRVIKVLAGIAAILSVSMVNEKLHTQNLFGFLGGVPLVPAIREGAIRAQGSFEHAIIAGTFGATLIHLFLLLWKCERSKIIAITGLVGATLITVTSASSTPLFAYLAAILAILMWPLRKSMRKVRWGIVGGLAALQLVMKAPIWFLSAHVDFIAGNSGYHRAELIDAFVRHFGDWWLIGATDSYTWGHEMGDIANQFVAEGELGGLLKFICFLLIISWSFSRIGKARKHVEGDRRKEWFFWLLGAALFAHVVALFGIGYNDQIKMAWLAFLAVISAATAPQLALGSVSELKLDLPVPDSRIAYPSPSVMARDRLAH